VIGRPHPSSPDHSIVDDFEGNVSVLKFFPSGLTDPGINEIKPDEA
jgi:hypothetical protein